MLKLGEGTEAADGVALFPVTGAGRLTDRIQEQALNPGALADQISQFGVGVLLTEQVQRQPGYPQA